MKLAHIILASLLFALTAVLAVTSPVLAAACLFVGAAALMQQPAQQGALLVPTLTPVVLLQQTIRALFVRCPALSFFAHDFTTERLKKDQQVIGKIRKRPVTGQYDANNGGYKAGAQQGRDLLVDVPFTMSQHLHVTLNVSHLASLGDSITDLEGHFQDSASVLGKAVNDHVLGKIGSKAFGNASTYSLANSNKDALNAIRKAMNKRGVGGPRFGLINSDVAEALEGDSRITNRYDNASQRNDADPHAVFRGLSGFQEIVEYPDMLTGNGADLTISSISTADLITTTAAHGLLVGDRVQFSALTGGAGLTAGGSTFYFVSDVPSTTTLKVSATRGGSAVDVTTAYTAGTMAKKENISGFFGTREAIAIKTALPSDGIDIAQGLGIPVTAAGEVVTDPDTGLSMICYKWFEPGTMDSYITFAVLYGATAGAIADVEQLAMEPSGQILRTA